jgi:Na+/melibiose symporter-like transporter
VSVVIGPLVSRGETQLGLLAVMGVLLAGAAATMLVREAPMRAKQPPVDKGQFLRLALMTGAFASIIIGIGGGVRVLLRWSSRLAPRYATLVVASAGTAGMLLAVVLGVSVCVRIAAGRRARSAQSFTWWVINRLAFLVATNGLSGFMLYFLQERFAELQAERAAGPASSAVLLVGVFVLLTAVPSGWLADRIGKRMLVALSGIVAAAGMTVLLWVPTMATVYVGGSLVGLAVGLFFTTNWALGTEVVPQEEAGRYLGLANLAGAGAGAIGAYIGGPIADHSSYVLVYGIYGSLFLASVLALGGIRVRQPAQAVGKPAAAS